MRDARARTIVSILRSFDCMVNSVDLAIFSGILWQGNFPEEANATIESRSQLQGMVSMPLGGC